MAVTKLPQPFIQLPQTQHEVEMLIEAYHEDGGMVEERYVGTIQNVLTGFYQNVLDIDGADSECNWLFENDEAKQLLNFTTEDHINKLWDIMNDNMWASMTIFNATFKCATLGLCVILSQTPKEECVTYQCNAN